MKRNADSALPLAGRLNINNVIFNKDFDQSICTQQHDAAAAVADRVRPSAAAAESCEHSIHLIGPRARGARLPQCVCYRSRSMIGDHVQHDRRRVCVCEPARGGISSACLCVCEYNIIHAHSFWSHSLSATPKRTGLYLTS